MSWEGYTSAWLEENHGTASRPAKKKRPKPAPQHDTGLFFILLDEIGIPCPTPEHNFHESRKWAFDFAWVDQKVALEVEGGQYMKGKSGHKGHGAVKDYRKYNEAKALGWVVLQCIPEWLPGQTMAIDGTLLDQITRLLEARNV